MDYHNLITILDDLKYINRMSLRSFEELLFPDAEETYLKQKWDLFRSNPLWFLWGCSYDKLEMICEYVLAFKEGELE